MSIFTVIAGKIGIKKGANTAEVKASSTAAVAADEALVVAVSPNNTPVLPNGAATESTVAGLLTDTELRASPVPVADGGGSLTVDGPLTDAELRATAVPVSAASLPLPAGAATEATLAALAAEDFATQTTLAALLSAFNAEDFATEAKLEAVRVLLASLDAKDFATQTTLASLLSAFSAEDFATQTTLATMLTQAGFEARINTQGQKAMAASTPTVIASDQSPVSVRQTPATPSAAVTMQNAATATGNGTSIPVTGYGTATVEVTGTFSATITWEGSRDGGTTWYSIRAIKQSTGDVKSTATTTGLYAIGTPALTHIRARISAYTSGSVTAVGVAVNAPVRSNDFGVHLKDFAGNSMEVEHTVAVPANTQGILWHGKTLAGVAAVPSVLLDGDDSKWRVAIEGKVSVSPPEPPATSGGRILIYADNPAIVPGNQTRDTVFVIDDTKRLFIQQVIVGAEGDPTESGSTVRLFYSPDGGTTELFIQKFFVAGNSYTISFPNLDETRNGTKIDGVATAQGQLIVRRERQGGGNQEIDATVICYEDTP